MDSAQHITFLPPFQQPCPGDAGPIHCKEVSVSKGGLRGLLLAMEKATFWQGCSVDTGERVMGWGEAAVPEQG